MRAHIVTVRQRALPRGWVDALRQVLLFAAAYYAYRIVRGAVDANQATSFENARHLIGIEQSLHTFFEPALQGWASSKSFLIDSASWLYVNSHFVITVAALVFIYIFRNDSFYFVRNMFVIAMGIALVCYLAYPTAPPRYFPEWGFHDSVSDFTGVPQDSVVVSALVNPYAAVPSMHVAFALMIGWPLARLVRQRPLKAFWFCYPFVITFAVLVTGNHFWLDAVFGAVTAGVSGYIAKTLLARARPHAWAFESARASVRA
jgi:membrane-associated phospholipid phosphatase